MRKLLLITLVLLTIQAVAANEAGVGIGIETTTEEFEPLIWLCNSRTLQDDNVEEGRDPGLNSRTNNYAFEGEQISWEVLVMDKNKIEQVQEVVATLGTTQGIGNDIEVECKEGPAPDGIPDSCNARILEERLTEFDNDIMAWYQCTLSIETPNSMYGEYWITIEVISDDGEATIDENEFWFLNPVVGISTQGSLVFEDVRPGTVSYSDSILVTNDADQDSGVLLDMFISGTDFYDPDSSGAACPTTNRLRLSMSGRSSQSLGPGTSSGLAASGQMPCNAGTLGITGTDNADHLCYYASGGGYATSAAPNADAEGFRPIYYGDKFSRDFYNDAEIVYNGNLLLGGTPYSSGNVLAPGADIALTFKLGLPEPCVGDFSDGQIYFWGEAI